MATALITGATSGIGASFADLLASERFDLILVARDLARLESKAYELRTKYSINVDILPADLSQINQVAVVEARLKDLTKPVEILVNNAGYGINKSFLVSEGDAEIALLDVLVTAPMKLMHAVLPGMKVRNHGIIINVSSVAGWIAAGSYSAAKSYITVLSESLHTELQATGVKVHVLCPGFTRTEFHHRGKMRMNLVPAFMWLDADRVVREAWQSAQKGEVISVPGWQYKVLSTFSRFGPRPLVRKVGMKVRVRQRPRE